MSPTGDAATGQEGCWILQCQMASEEPKTSVHEFG